MWRSKDSLQESGPRDWTKVTRLGGKHFYPLCHLSSMSAYVFLNLSLLTEHVQSNISQWLCFELQMCISNTIISLK